MGEMVYCPRCGVELVPGARFCGRRRFELPAEAAPSQVEAPPTPPPPPDPALSPTRLPARLRPGALTFGEPQAPPQPPQAPQPPRRSRVTALVVGIIVLLLAAIATGLFLLLRGRGSTPGRGGGALRPTGSRQSEPQPESRRGPRHR